MSKVNAAFSSLFWTQRQIVKLCIKLRIEPGVADGWLSNVCLWLWIRNNQNFVFFKVCVKTFSGYLLLESRYASAKFLTEHEAGNTTEMRESGEAEIQTHKQCSQDWNQGEVSSNFDQEWCISSPPSQERENIWYLLLHWMIHLILNILCNSRIFNNSDTCSESKLQII